MVLGHSEFDPNSGKNPVGVFPDEVNCPQRGWGSKQLVVSFFDILSILSDSLIYKKVQEKPLNRVLCSVSEVLLWWWESNFACCLRF